MRYQVMFDKYDSMYHIERRDNSLLVTRLGAYDRYVDAIRECDRLNKEEVLQAEKIN